PTSSRQKEDAARRTLFVSRRNAAAVHGHLTALRTSPHVQLATLRSPDDWATKMVRRLTLLVAPLHEFSTHVSVEDLGFVKLRGFAREDHFSLAEDEYEVGDLKCAHDVLID